MKGPLFFLLCILADGPTMKQRIAATSSAMEDVVATRITSMTSVAVEGRAGEGIWVAQLNLKPFSRQLDRTN
ncbi:hypothetical protein ANCDUO_05993 [Ancylostoma duodenale]|uniref:Uncharacterized protein n=1 Tax=Ancylostoma duodenale TaxID=51022 RepID=A0A0C2GXA5_9BILA|nr:hypothetical protein ANCDUO_05993 [Ancylostoma duodenale]